MEASLTNLLNKYLKLKLITNFNDSAEALKNSEAIQKLSKLLHTLFFEEFKALAGDQFIDNYEESLREASNLVDSGIIVNIQGTSLSIKTPTEEKVLPLFSPQKLAAYLMTDEAKEEDIKILMELFCSEKESYISLNLLLLNNLSP